jgi:sulfhydrogenase subunit beta (sulfur reductase)
MFQVVVTAMVYRIETAAVQSLIEVLHQQNYSVLGPTRSDGSIVYDEIHAAADLPKGWTEEQRPGYYRIRKRNDEALFGFTIGPHTWKKFLFPPISKLFSASRNAKGFNVQNDMRETKNGTKPLAFFGVRPCELHAIDIQDKVFASGDYKDPQYSKIRSQLFIVAVNCSHPAETCFCSSMGTGPGVNGHNDLALTEIIDEKQHFFLIEAGSPKGEQVLEKVQHRPAEGSEVSKGEDVVRSAASSMKRTLDTKGIKELLYKNAEHPEWEKVGARCLSCTNCTMVCPTCFCNTVEDSTDLGGTQATRTRKWDSCFTLDFSYIHGGNIRTSTKARYRQWMTHKLASWIDQFGISGCVGCGRCITWCPVGIDITDETRVIRENSVVQERSQA